MAKRTQSVDSGHRPYRLSVEQFERMIETGAIPDGDDVELIRGRLYRMIKKEPHNFAVGRTAELLRRILPDGFHVREEKAMRHDEQTLLEPDVVVARGGSGEYRTQTPSTSEVSMIVEVCHHSRRVDYLDKLILYAEARVPVYWIINLQDRKIDALSEPRRKSPKTLATFTRVAVFCLEEQFAPVVLDGREVGRIAVRDLLAPP